jgi:Class III signal peptide
LIFSQSKKGQVAVEFLLMFILVISVIIYAFYFAVSFAALNYRSYQTFMVGRAILSSSDSYATKLTRATTVNDMYEQSLDTAIKNNISKTFTCDFSGNNAIGFRGIMDYGFKPDFDVFSNAGIACSVYANYILPAVVTRSGGNQLKVALESMTGSEITDDHCLCALDPNNTWGGCLQSVSQSSSNQPLFYIDNGC